jgi:hypothetical protein
VRLYAAQAGTSSASAGQQTATAPAIGVAGRDLQSVDVDWPWQRRRKTLWRAADPHQLKLVSWSGHTALSTRADAPNPDPPIKFVKINRPGEPLIACER